MGARQKYSNDDVIEMVEQIDPITGEPIYAEASASRVPATLVTLVTPTGPPVPARPPAGPTLRGGQVAAAGALDGDGDGAQPGIDLPRTRFAGTGFGEEFEHANRAHGAGMDVRLTGGRMVAGDDQNGSGSKPEAIELTSDRFAALSAEERTDFYKLVETGAAERYVDILQSTGEMRDYFPVDPGGVYLRTQQTRRGDVLHAVIQRDPGSRLYHAHLWTFELANDGRRSVVDLNRYVGQPGLSAHDVHLYPGRGGHGAVLCLSTATRGGMPSLAACVVRAAWWADGMGAVLRGLPFPYDK